MDYIQAEKLGDTIPSAAFARKLFAQNRVPGLTRQEIEMLDQEIGERIIAASLKGYSCCAFQMDGTFFDRPADNFTNDDLECVRDYIEPKLTQLGYEVVFPTQKDHMVNISWK